MDSKVNHRVEFPSKAALDVLEDHNQRKDSAQLGRDSQGVTDCRCSIRTSVFCWARVLFCLLGWMCVCVGQFVDSSSPGKGGAGDSPQGREGNKEQELLNLSNTNSRCSIFLLQKWNKCQGEDDTFGRTVKWLRVWTPKSDCLDWSLLAQRLVTQAVWTLSKSLTHSKGLVNISFHNSM